jgi:hypothetical protein
MSRILAAVKRIMGITWKAVSLGQVTGTPYPSPVEK